MTCRIQLEPLSLDHLATLSDELSVDNQWFAKSYSIRTREEILGALRMQIQHRENGARIPFAMVDRQARIPVGISCFMRMRPDERALEIGFTWIGGRWRRTHVNTEAKYQMLHLAFERLKCDRVEFRVEDENEISHRAVLRIGAVLESEKLKECPRPDGTQAMARLYRILRSDWPEVRKALERRIRGTDDVELVDGAVHSVSV